MQPTRVAVLTGMGVGAVAVVQIWGPDAIKVADACFRPVRRDVLGSTPGRPRLGRVGAGMGDEVVAIAGPGDGVEIQCHGGPAAVALVVDALVVAGAERASASAWIRHQAGSRLRAEAMLDLPHASTFRAASHLLDQANCALDNELRLIHASMDIARLDQLIARGRIGTRLLEGWRVVLAGRPNVGKSRLLNALVGFDRAIVDPSAGTTRDVVTSTTAFDGWPVELGDTAGLRAPEDAIEAQGVERARASQRAADLILLVLDRSEPLTDQDRRLIAEYPTALIVANKVDLPSAWDDRAVPFSPLTISPSPLVGEGRVGGQALAEAKNPLPYSPPQGGREKELNSPAWDGIGLAVSAERGDGIDRLSIEIGRRLVPDPPPEGCGMPFRPRHLRRLALIRRAILAGDRDRAARSLGRWLERDKGVIRTG
jgi:tRNA modification GTPase